MSLYIKLQECLGDKTWLDKEYSKSVTNRDIIDRVIRTCETLTTDTLYKTTTNWIPNMIVTILATYITSSILDITYIHQNKYNLSLNRLSTGKDKSDIIDRLPKLKNTDNNRIWLVGHNITTTPNQLYNSIINWSKLTKYLGGVTNINFEYITQYRPSLISLLLYCFLNGITVTNSKQADYTIIYPNMIYHKNITNKLYVCELEDRPIWNLDCIFGRHHCFITDNNEIIAIGTIEDAILTISKSILRVNQDIVLSRVSYPKDIENNLLDIYLAKRGDFICEASVVLPISSFDIVLSSIILLYKTYPILTYKFNNVFSKLTHHNRSIALDKNHISIVDGVFSITDSIGILCENRSTSHVYIVKNNNKYIIYGIYSTVIRNVNPLLEKIRRLVVDLQVKSSIKLTQKIELVTKSLFRDPLNSLQINHNLGLKTGMLVIKNIIGSYISNSVTDKLIPFCQTLNIKTYDFIDKLYTLHNKRGIIILWTDECVPTVYGGKYGNNFLVAGANMMASEFLSLSRNNILSEFTIHIRILPEKQPNPWLDKVQIENISSRKSKQKIIILEGYNKIIVSGSLVESIYNKVLK